MDDIPNDATDDAAGNGGMTERRQRSSISFPYGDLDDAEVIARTIQSRLGTGCEVDQLAAALGKDESNGTFRQQVATARIFGAIEVARRHITLTDLGARLADDMQVADARVQAFLRVPLYTKLFDAYRGRQLPGDAGLESDIVRLGVSPKQADKARRAFQRSAGQAGFFNAGRDRLVRPASSGAASVEPAPEPEEESKTSVTPHTETLDLADLHPLLLGLIRTIPREGETFSPKRQRQWLEAAKVNFALIFGSDDDEESRPAEPGEGSGSVA